MKRLFLCHHSAFFDRVLPLATELHLRGIAPWVAPDGGFMVGDDQEAEARRIIREESYGLLLYATPDVLERDFIRRVEMREALKRRRRDDLLRWIRRKSEEPYLVAAILDGIGIEDLRRESRRYLGHDLARYTGIRLGEDPAAAAAAVLAERVGRLPPRPHDLALQFSTRDPLPDSDNDVLRIEGARALSHPGDTAGWSRIASGVVDVKRALGVRTARPTLWIHGSRHLTASFLLGHTFTRSSGFPLVIRSRDTWWSSNGFTNDPALRITFTEAASAKTLALRIQATDKNVGPASDTFLSARGIGATRLDVRVDHEALDDARARGAAAAIRDAVVRTTAAIGATQILLFAAVPQALAVLLGAEWNAMPPTRLHEFDGVRYVPSLRLG